MVCKEGTYYAKNKEARCAYQQKRYAEIKQDPVRYKKLVKYNTDWVRKHYESRYVKQQIQFGVHKPPSKGVSFVVTNVDFDVRTEFNKKQQDTFMPPVQIPHECKEPVIKCVEENVIVDFFGDFRPKEQTETIAHMPLQKRYVAEVKHGVIMSLSGDYQRQ